MRPGIELVLPLKGKLAGLGSLDKIPLGEDPSVGAAWTLQAAARRLGRDRALGHSFGGQLALWQAPARAAESGVISLRTGPAVSWKDYRGGHHGLASALCASSTKPTITQTTAP